MHGTISECHTPYIAPFAPVFFSWFLFQVPHLLLPINSKDGRSDILGDGDLPMRNTIFMNITLGLSIEKMGKTGFKEEVSMTYG
jgi:hypothetical protein